MDLNEPEMVQGPNDSFSAAELYREKSWNVFIKNHNLFLTEERKTWASWMK